MGVNTPYDLKGLTDEQSWILLNNVIFGEYSSRVSFIFQTIGEKIANKCEGVPLAIKTIGGFLQQRIDEADQWSSLLNDDIWRLCKVEHSIMPVLNLSYQNLPLELRQCFAYCCLYPKDSIIKKEELVQLWMAQGYLENSSEAQSMENVGNRYVKILLMGSFFQEASMDICGDIVHFKMHDLMHDLATSVAGNDAYLHVEGKGNVGNPMHAAFEKMTISSLDMFGASKLRTIILWKNRFASKVDSTAIPNFKYLRTLNLSNSFITELPESIDKVKYLRYLDLSYCRYLRTLPKSVGNLLCLQTLKLRRCANLVFPAKIITKLINLRCLDIEGCKTFENMMPTGLERLTSLQYLSSFVVGDNKKGTSGKLNELKELNNMGGELTISNLGLVEDVASESHETNLKSKQCIQGLNLIWGTGETRNSDSLMLLNNLCPHWNLRNLSVKYFPGMTFLPDWLISLTNIVSIKLERFPNCQRLPHLERLPCLKDLVIRFMGPLKWMHYSKDIGDVFFPSLERLEIWSCHEMMGWERLRDDKTANENENHVSLPSFPHLSSLQILSCENLIYMPAFPHLVEKLELTLCSMKAMLETLVKHESSTVCPLSSLKHLVLWEVTDIEAMAEDWMKNLTSLQSLNLRGSSNVEVAIQQLEHLPSQLQILEIGSWGGDKLELWKDKDDDSTQCRGPPRALSSLQSISFISCLIMKALPEQICTLQSLRHIQIVDCHEVESLHEAVGCLTNLQSLWINDCPILEHRYSAEGGEDRPKIAHIPNITIYRD